jgi:hypothetical protein
MAVTLHPPEQPGTYAQRFGWRVTVKGFTAYSGDERGAKDYARAMRRREREGSLA